MLKYDTNYGPYQGTVDATEKSLLVDGKEIAVLSERDPGVIPWSDFDVSLVIESTGFFTDGNDAKKHIQGSVNKVIITAPAKNEDITLVLGVNEEAYNPSTHKVISNASCTTNCIAPILHIVENKYGVEKGHLETVHSYTNDQNLLDNMHKKPRRGRSAAINMVITSTGAGNAVTKVIPSLAGKLSANAVRVPTPNVSLAILKLSLNRTTSIEDLNATMRDAALRGNLVNQINYQVDPELVSTDIIGNSCCSVFDSNATIVTKDGKDVVLYVWYDNEFGYTKQVIRLAKLIAKVRRLTYY